METRKRAAAVILKDDQILMVKISDQGRSWWCLPGGTIEPGETPEQAIARELSEEPNLIASPSRRIYESQLPDEPRIDYGILVDLPPGDPSIGIDRAVVAWAWFPMDEVGDSWQVLEVKKALR